MVNSGSRAKVAKAGVVVVVHLELETKSPCPAPCTDRVGKPAAIVCVFESQRDWWGETKSGQGKWKADESAFYRNLTLIWGLLATTWTPPVDKQLKRNGNQDLPGRILLIASSDTSSKAPLRTPLHCSLAIYRHGFSAEVWSGAGEHYSWFPPIADGLIVCVCRVSKVRIAADLDSNIFILLLFHCWASQSQVLD